ncbi:MAG: glycosyltransferase family 4 protein [Devosia sp.]
MLDLAPDPATSPETGEPQETSDAATSTARLLAQQPLAGRKVLIVVENLPVPFDRRVWQEATTLRQAGATVSVICPKGKGYQGDYEQIDGIHIYRHSLPLDAKGALGYLVEYGTALFHELRLSLKVARCHGFDTLHACNPPDLLFLLAWPLRLFGVRYIFDHHDINPELYEAKMGKRGLFWHLMVMFERLNFAAAHVVISTNQSYRRIAIERGNKRSSDIFVVRSGPNIGKLRPTPPDPALRNGRKHLVAYVGVMGDQEGIDLLLESVRHLVYDLGRSDIQFCLVGGGTSLDELIALSAKLGLSDYVTFTGRAPDETLFRVLSTADVCVNPDRVNAMNDKSTMNKILEYMAFGKPIVQFDVTEGRFSAQEASLYAKANAPQDFADKIVDLIVDPAQRQRRGAIGRQRVLHGLSWDHEIPNLIAAYRHATR